MRRFLVASSIVGFCLLNGIHAVLFNLYLLRLGYGPEFVGWVSAVGTLSFALSALPAGLLASRIGLRRAMTLGLVIGAFGFGLLSISDVIPVPARAPWLIVNRVVAIVGLALFFVNATPFLAGATTEEARDHAYSIRMVLDSLAGFSGSLIGGVLPGLIALLLGISPEHPAAYRYTLLAASVICLPAAWAMSSIPEVETEQETEPEAGQAVVWERGVFPVSLIGAMALVVLLRGAGVGTSRTFFNVYMDDGLGMPTARIGLLLAVIQLLAVPAALLTPVLTARRGAFRVTLVGSLGVAFSMLPIALVPHWAAATVGQVGIYALSSIADVALMAYQMALVAPRWRTHMAGTTSMAMGLSWTALSVGGGYLIAGLGYRELFLLAGGLTALGTVLLGLIFGRRSIPGQSYLVSPGGLPRPPAPPSGDQTPRCPAEHGGICDGRGLRTAPTSPDPSHPGSEAV